MPLNRTISPLLMLLAPALPASAQTVIPITQPIAGIDAVTVVSKAGSGEFIFDSGLGVSAVTPATAAKLGCTPWGKITGFRAIGERVDLQRCNAADVVIGGFRRRLSELSVIDLTKLMGAAGDRFAGGIGLDAFDGEIVTLSIARHQLTVEDSRRWKAPPSGAIAVPVRLVRAAEGAALTASIGIATASGTVWLEIDTGNYGPSRIDRHSAALLGLDPEAKGRQHLLLDAGHGAALSGDAVVGDLIMDGNVGRGMLRNWDVMLDLKNGRGWLKKSAGGA